MVSQFTQALVDAPTGFDFVAAHFECENNAWSPANPEGYVNLGSAQNFLAVDDVGAMLSGMSWADPALQKYQAFTGMPDCRKQVASYMSELAGLEGEDALPADHIIPGNGLIGLLEALAVALLDDGDAVLVPTPVFPGLVTALSLRVRSRVSLLETTSDSDFQLTPALLEAALAERRVRGERIRAVLLCSPGNPVGCVYTEQQMRQFAAIAARYDGFLIVDEIYAGGCFGSPFFSAAALKQPQVCVLGGLSKDFGVAGYATGWVYANDERVRRALAQQSHFFRMSTTAQCAMQSILAQQKEHDYLVRHRQRLNANRELAVNLLEPHGITCSAASAGLCLWLDLRNALSASSQAAELQLYERLLREFRVHISPGQGFFTRQSGYFRLCFSHPAPQLAEGIQRLVTGLAVVGAERDLSGQRAARTLVS
ncbi:MAG: pyridoxal phosphate-dependent aminotransferase [Planctomycetaceae bacterium]|nr:pyridoxal phosphate-dependent aminotransferase [Planctomycetaceae bacterium]